MSASTETIQLAVRLPLPLSDSTLVPTDSSDAPVRNEVILAPVDGGFGAWSFLAAAFLAAGVVWGLPNGFGVFLATYLKDPSYASQPNAGSLLPLIGTLSSGIMYASGPVLSPLISRMPYLRRPLTYIGAVLCCVSLLGASYAHKIEVLVALQGVLYAVGGSMLYLPCISYMSEWFVARRGLASGVIFAGTAVGGLILPLVLPGLIHAYGVPKTLRVLSIAIAIVLAPVVPFIRGRLPEARVRGPGARSGTRARPWLHDTSFWMLMAVNTLQGFAYFVPVLWLPTFASALNLSDSDASVAIALLNGAAVVARLTMGILSDKFDPWVLGLCTLAISSLVTFVLWGVLAHTFAGLVCFGLAYGIIASGWTSLWTGFVRPIAKDDPTLPTTLFGLLMLSRGVGNVLSTPISTSLLRAFNRGQEGAAAHSTTGFNVGAGRYERMIVYVGTCFAGAAVVAGLGWGMRRRSAQH